MKVIRDAVTSTVSKKVFPVDGLVERPALEKRIAGRTFCVAVVAFVLAACGIGIVTFFQSRYETSKSVTACEKPVGYLDCQDTTQYPLKFDGEVNPFYSLRLQINQHFTANELSKHLAEMLCAIAVNNTALIWRSSWGQPAGMEMIPVCQNPKHAGAAVLFPPRHMAKDVEAVMVKVDREERFYLNAAESKFAIAEIDLGRSGNWNTSGGANLSFSVFFLFGDQHGIKSRSSLIKIVYGAPPDCSRSDLRVADIAVIQNGIESRCGAYWGDPKCLDWSNTYQLLQKTGIPAAAKIVKYFTHSLSDLKAPIPYHDENFLLYLRKHLCSGYDLPYELELYEKYWVDGSAWVLGTANHKPRKANQIVSDLANTLLKDCPFHWYCRESKKFPNPFVWFSVAYPLLMMVLRILVGALPTMYTFCGKSSAAPAPGDLESKDAWGDPKKNEGDMRLRTSAAADGH